MRLNRFWLMAMCVVGMGAIFILPALGIGVGSLFAFLMILLCPLSHLLMMRGFGGQGGSCHGPGNEQVPSKTKVSAPADAKVAVAIGDRTSPKA